MWFQIKASEEACGKNWWTNMLYINNLVNTNELVSNAVPYKVSNFVRSVAELHFQSYEIQCNGESWYLANDMQFYILVPFIVYPVWKWETMGLILLTIYTTLACIAQVLVVRYVPDAPAMAITGQ